MSSLAHRLAPELEAGPAAPLVGRFVEDMMAQVIRPLFGADSVDQFRERLPDALDIGINLRTRFMLDVVETDLHAVVRDMLTTPPREVHDNLTALARMFLPSDPFMLVRAFQLSEDMAIVGQRLMRDRISKGFDRARLLRGMGELGAAAGPHDAMFTAWVLLCLAKEPHPSGEVARVAAAELLRLGETRREVLKRALEDDPSWSPPEIVVERGSELDAYLEAHPRLSLELGPLLAVAASDQAVRTVKVRVTRDRDTDDAWLTVEAWVPAEDWERVDALVDDLKARSGVVAPSDGRGGFAMLTVRPE